MSRDGRISPGVRSYCYLTWHCHRAILLLAFGVRNRMRSVAARSAFSASDLNVLANGTVYSESKLMSFVNSTR